MARKGRQLQERLRRVEMANRLLKWLEEEQLLEGSHTFETVIVPFSQIEKVEVFEVWKAWELLKESGRRHAKTGGPYSILDRDPIKADQFGNIIGVRKV